MKRFTQAQKEKIWAVVLSAAIGSIITDDEWSNLLGIHIRSFMNYKKRAKGLLEEMMETEAKK